MRVCVCERERERVCIRTHFKAVHDSVMYICNFSVARLRTKKIHRKNKRGKIWGATPTFDIRSLLYAQS